MAEPFISQITLFAGNFAPRGYAMCNGQLLPIAQNQALTALLGATYGGDGRVTIGVPDLRGRVPAHVGTGPGLSPRFLGQRLGVETVVVRENEIPVHTHNFMGSTDPATSDTPTDNVFATVGGTLYSDGVKAGTSTLKDMKAGIIGDTGSYEPHSNMMPYLCINFIIALKGAFPARN